MKREHWEKRRTAWASALYQGGSKEMAQPLRQILGSVAWGRYEGESQPDEVKDNIVFGCGYLEGVRYAALQAGRVFKLKGTAQLEGIHSRIRKEAS